LRRLADPGNYQFDKPGTPSTDFKGKTGVELVGTASALPGKKKKIATGKSGETHALLDIARKGTADS
jgi:hypothetical protein